MRKEILMIIFVFFIIISINDVFAIVDNVSPFISLISPADATSSTASAYNFTFYTIEVNNVSSCSLVIDGAYVNKLNKVNFTGGINGMYNSSFSSATHTWSVNCTDSFGNIGNSSSRTFTVSAPVVEENSSGGGGGGGTCQYKTYTGTGIYVNNLYDNNGTKYLNPIALTDFGGGYLGGLSCTCATHYTIKNNIDKSISMNIQYQVSLSKGDIYYHNKSFIIPSLNNILVEDSINICDNSVSCSVNQNSISYQFITNDETISKIEEMKNRTCKRCGNNLCLNDGANCTYDFQCGSNVCSQSGNAAGHCISQPSDFDSRLSILELWKQLIDDWKDSLVTLLTSLTTKVDDHETRITTLENKNYTQPNITIKDYWKYLDSGTKKDIVCGIAIDNHLTTLTMQELGWKCNITYRQTSKGEKASCRCDKV